MLARGKGEGQAMGETRAEVLVEQEGRQGAPSGGWWVREPALTSRREGQRGSNMVRPEVGKVGKHLFLRHAAGQLLQDISDGDPSTLDAGLPAPDAGSGGNEVLEAHGNRLAAMS